MMHDKSARQMVGLVLVVVGLATACTAKLTGTIETRPPQITTTSVPAG